MTVLNWAVFMYCESSKQIQLTALCALMCIVWSMPTSSNICNQFAVTSSFLLLVSRSCSGPISCCHVSLRTARCKRLVHVRKSWRTGSTSGTNDRKKNCTSNYSYTRPDPVRRIPTFVKTFRIHRWALAGPCTWDEIETEKEMRPHMVSAWLWYAGRMLYCAVVSITWAFYRVCGTNELCSKGLVPSEGAKGMLTRQLTRRNSME